VSTLANMAVDLLCKLSFSPEGGHDPEDMADVEQGWWQSLIHDLSPHEHEEVVLAAKRQIKELRSTPPASLPGHLQRQLDTLKPNVDGGQN